jgi:hypothetical protein
MVRLRNSNMRNATFLLFSELQVVATNGLLTRHTGHMDISTEIATRTSPIPSPLSAALYSRGSPISAQHAKQALSL